MAVHDIYFAGSFLQFSTRCYMERPHLQAYRLRHDMDGSRSILPKTWRTSRNQHFSRRKFISSNDDYIATVHRETANDPAILTLIDKKYNTEDKYELDIEEVLGLECTDDSTVVIGSNKVEVFSISGIRTLDISGISSSGKIITCHGNGYEILYTDGNTLYKLNTATSELSNVTTFDVEGEITSIRYMKDESIRILTQTGSAKLCGESIEVYAELLENKNAQVLASFEHKYWGKYAAISKQEGQGNKASEAGQAG